MRTGRYRILLVVALCLLAIVAARATYVARLTQPYTEEDFVAGDARGVAGAWQAELRVGRRTLWLPIGGQPTHGQLELTVRPHQDSSGVQVACPGCLTGTLRARLSLRGYNYPDSLPVMGYVMRDGRLFFSAGGCCDQGELEFQLVPRDAGFHGAWRQQFLMPGHTGAAWLRRPPAEKAGTGA